MPKELPPLPPGWTEHTAPTGHKYYWNVALKKSTYKRPTEAAPDQTPTTTSRKPEPEIRNTALIAAKENVVPLTEWSSVTAVDREDSPERTTARMMEDEMWKKLEDRPRKKTEIPGAEPWTEVTTKWQRHFYHNPATNESYWKIPEVIREAVEQWHLETARAEAAGNQSESEDSDDYSQSEGDPNEIPVEFGEEDIAYQLAMLQDEYGEADEMVEEELDPAAIRQIFVSLLEEKDVNPFNPWETEMPKIVADPRYSMVKNTKQRLEIFGVWARARIALIKEEKAQETKEDPKVGFLRLLSEKGDPKEYWFEFRRRNKKTPEYKHYGNEKLKEDMWRDWIARKKMSREKREAELLSWMRDLKGAREEILEKVYSDVRYWVLGTERDDLVMDALRGR